MIDGKRSLRLFGAGLLMLTVAACAGAERDMDGAASGTGPGAAATGALFDANRLEADVRFLADDSLRGREVGTRGYRIAANFVASRFRALDLAPAGEGESYFQQVPFRTASVSAEDAGISLTVDGETRTLEMGPDFITFGSVANPQADVEGPVVFAGYGIHAPKLGHDDLAGLDLHGKVALVLSGAPGSFNSEVRAHHGSTGTKAEELAERGARGVLVVKTRVDEKRRPFARMKRYIGHESFDWVRREGDEGGAAARVEMSASISHDVAADLLASGGLSLDSVLTAAETGAPQGAALNARVAMHRNSQLGDVVHGANVAGMLPGTDPALRDEVVVMTAHLDHVGVQDHEEGEDKIANGALDNAAGTAVMLEVARAFAEPENRPARSLLFLAVTAEEKGLLGAEYYAEYPTVDMPRLVANVNLDMPVLLYDFSDVVAFGADRSSLGPIAEKAVKGAGVTLSPDPMPEEGIFTRSDHYRFVEKGVPAIFLMTGWGETADGVDGGAKFRDFLANTYHGPKDDLNQPIDYQAGAKFAHVNWLIIRDLANAVDTPHWNAGDFFGETFNGPMADD
ncbi:M20/M25/M40 family metallo-hydrolase [Yunchengibacter salinarum]|uniref:M20/M25/M40 family metallo-hydrolase n=1 Tax=Yunchengibacter salinarum TaxID=3133399 RepID=UPI0035B69794